MSYGGSNLGPDIAVLGFVDVDRREFLAMLAAGLVATLTSCASEQAASMKSPGLPGAAARTGKVGGAVGDGPAAAPRPPSIVFEGPKQGQTIALTVDDGYCETCVDAYVAFARRTGTALTFSPNGTYHRIWDRYADRLRPLIEAGQVQIGNHTWTHGNLLRRSEPAIRGDIERNEEWIQRTFGITSRPWFRPPYGAHDARTDEIAGSLGYTKSSCGTGRSATPGRSGRRRCSPRPTATCGQGRSCWGTRTTRR